MPDKNYQTIVDALDVLARGASKKTNGKITGVNVAKEAGISKASLYRYFKEFPELDDAYRTLRRNGRCLTEDAPETLQDEYRLLMQEVKSLRSVVAQEKKDSAKMNELKSHQIQLLWMDNERLQAEVERLSAQQKQSDKIKPDNVTILPTRMNNERLQYKVNSLQDKNNIDNDSVFQKSIISSFSEHLTSIDGETYFETLVPDNYVLPMCALIFIGIPASGKSSFYYERFFHTHINISLDILKTRDREMQMFQSCLDAKKSFVIDNTNPMASDRKRYINPAKAAGFNVIGYYFVSNVQDALARNRKREGGKRIPDNGILKIAKQLELPSLSEGFDEIWSVKIRNKGGFSVEKLSKKS